MKMNSHGRVSRTGFKNPLKPVLGHARTACSATKPCAGAGATGDWGSYGAPNRAWSTFKNARDGIFETTCSRVIPNRESGFVAIFLAFAVVVIFGIVALVVDVGVSYFMQRQLQVAADASSFAAARLLGTSPLSDSTVVQEAHALAASNGVATSEFGSAECGLWLPSTRKFSPCGSHISGNLVCSQCGDYGVNAVRVKGNRQVRTSFARFLGVNELMTNVLSVTYRRDLETIDCLKPFGVEQDLLGPLDDPIINVGDTFVAGNTTPGNWGKVSIPPVQASSGADFLDYMHNCKYLPFTPGQVVDSGTGFGGSIKKVLEPFFDDKAEMYFLVAKEFFNGKKPIQLLEVIKVRFEEQGGNGERWWGRFTLLKRPALIDSNSSSSLIERVLVQ